MTMSSDGRDSTGAGGGLEPGMRARAICLLPTGTRTALYVARAVLRSMLL